MTSNGLWHVQGATSEDDLKRILASAANGLKTQVIASPVLGDERYERVRARISSIADELHGMQVDIDFPRLANE